MPNAAERCFTENLRLIGRDASGQPRDPIAWQLNAGLLALTQQVAALQSELEKCRAEIHRMRRDMPQR